MKNRESPTPQRNIEKDKQFFREAISAFQIAEVPTDFDEATSRQLIESLKNTRLFILGEMHGVQENANIIYTLFKKFGFRQLALEWEPRVGDAVEKFLASGELDFDAIKDSPDGRVTAGHFALVKKLKDEGMLDRLVCFDEGGADWNDRDRNMAKKVIANLSDAPTLAVAGNLHAETEAITFDEEPGEHHPMGENIRRLIADVAAGNIEYRAGQFYNYGIKEFGSLPNREKLQKARFLYRDGIYEFGLPEAHAATVPNPHERISR